MFYQYIPFFSAVPPEATPVVVPLSLAPDSPGDLGTAPATWTTKVTATGGLTQVKWAVGVVGAKTIEFPMGVANNTSVPTYNHGDVINFTGYGTGFTLVKDASGPNVFYASGSLGNNLFTIGSETQVADIRYTVDGSGGTGPLGYTIVNLTNGQADIQATFDRPGDRLIVKDVDETASVETAGVLFSGPLVKSIKMVPHEPGDLGTAPQSWTTRINAVGMTQVQWIVLDANWVGSGTTEFTVVNLVNGAATITCNLLKTGDRLVVKSIDFAQEDVSGQVIFSGGAKTLSMSPLNPGNLGTSPATWETDVTATNMASFEWAIKNADGGFPGTWFVANVTNNHSIVRPTFTSTGQRLIVSTPDNSVFQESGLVSFGTVAQPGGSDYQFARDFVKDLTVGVNLERGTALGRGVGYYQKLMQDGNITHIRHFAPSRPDWSIVSESGINNFADACQDAIAAGLKVSFSACDVISQEYAESQQIKDYVDMAARVFASRNMDPRKFAFGAWNELGEWTNDNSASNAIRRYYKDLIRGYFPNHCIIIGSANWGAWEALCDPSMEVFTDKRVLYEWHRYPFPGQDISYYEDMQNNLNDFANAHGVVTICGELAMAGETGGTDPATIPGAIYAASRGAWQQRINIWTITYGSLFRMNNSGDYNLTPEIAAAFREANTYIRAQPGFGT